MDARFTLKKKEVLGLHIRLSCVDVASANLQAANLPAIAGR